MRVRFCVKEHPWAEKVFGGAKIEKGCGGKEGSIS